MVEVVKYNVGDFVTFKGYSDGIPDGGISYGEIIEINGEFCRVVCGGIDLNRTNHHIPNYMIPIRVRPMLDDDTIYKCLMSSLSTIDKTNWGK